jgi:hypothetical protein
MRQPLLYWGLILFLSLNSLPAFCDEAVANIPLTGTITKGSTRSASTIAPIEAYLTDAGVVAYFNKALGDITVTITNEPGTTVYQTIVDSDTEDTLSISMSDLAAGTYTIKFSCDYGQKTGTFYW